MKLQVEKEAGKNYLPVVSGVKEGEEDTCWRVGDNRRRTATEQGIKGRPEL